MIDAEVAAAVVDDENTDENDNKEVEGSTIAAERKMIHVEELNAVENCHQYFEQHCAPVMDLIFLHCLLDETSKQRLNFEKQITTTNFVQSCKCSLNNIIG